MRSTPRQIAPRTQYPGQQGPQFAIVRRAPEAFSQGGLGRGVLFSRHPGRDRLGVGDRPGVTPVPPEVEANQAKAQGRREQCDPAEPPSVGRSRPLAHRIGPFLGVGCRGRGAVMWASVNVGVHDRPFPRESQPATQRKSVRGHNAARDHSGLDSHARAVGGAVPGPPRCGPLRLAAEALDTGYNRSRRRGGCGSADRPGSRAGTCCSR